MWKLFLLSLVFYFTKSQETCVCPYFHPQNSICKTGATAIKGIPISVFHQIDPLSGEQLPTDPEELFNYDGYTYRYYVIKVTKHFVETDNSDELVVFRVPGRRDDCGFMLYEFGEQPKQWLLTGSKTRGGFVETDSCWFNKPWAEVTGKQKEYLQKRIYLNNCDCLVAHCFEDIFFACVPTPVPDNACIHYEPGIDDCYVRDLVCRKTSRRRRRRGGDNCNWTGKNKNDCVSNNPDN